jgi:hypothetical protein
LAVTTAIPTGGHGGFRLGPQPASALERISAIARDEREGREHLQLRALELIGKRGMVEIL